MSYFSGRDLLDVLARHTYIDEQDPIAVKLFRWIDSSTLRDEIRPSFD